jgi:hypothetical protein
MLRGGEGNQYLKESRMGGCNLELDSRVFDNT